MRSCGLSLVLFAVLGCGPGVTGEGSSEAGGSRGSGGADTTSMGSLTASNTSSMTTTGGPGTTGSTTTSSSEASEDDGPSIKLDVLGFDVGAEPGNAGPYEPCEGGQGCQPGLECVLLGVGMDIVYSACTVPCQDAIADCPQIGWPTVCFPTTPEQSVCALSCEMGRCPPQMDCLDSPVEICAGF